VLILVAVVLLGIGLAQGSNALLIGSIAVSLLAAIALVVGARQAAAGRVDEVDELDGAVGPEPGDEEYERYEEPALVGAPALERGQTAPAAPLFEPPPVPAQPAAAPTATAPVIEPADDADDEDPPDEPAAQLVSAADAARVAGMGTEVLVIDGRPRYHLAGCVHLLGREHDTLPVSEAVELGFSPCSLCEPDSALLAEARRV
jgi:hypothetical protein